MMSIYKLLEDIVDFVDGSANLPLTQFKLIDTRALKTLIKQRLMSLPAEMQIQSLERREKEIIGSAEQQSQQILSQAEMQAKSIVESAQQEAQRLTSQSEILKAVHYEVEKVRESLKEETRKVYELAEREIINAESGAQREIEQTINEAIQEADKIRGNAYSYASFILEHMEHLSNGTLELIQDGQDRINNLQAVDTSAKEATPELNKIPDLQLTPYFE